MAKLYALYAIEAIVTTAIGIRHTQQREAIVRCASPKNPSFVSFVHCFLHTKRRNSACASIGQQMVIVFTDSHSQRTFKISTLLFELPRIGPKTLAQQNSMAWPKNLIRSAQNLGRPTGCCFPFALAIWLPPPLLLPPNLVRLGCANQAARVGVALIRQATLRIQWSELISELSRTLVQQPYGLCALNSKVVARDLALGKIRAEQSGSCASQGSEKAAGKSTRSLSPLT